MTHPCFWSSRSTSRTFIGMSSRPIVAIQAPILHRFRQMLRADTVRAAEVRDGARHLEDAVVGAGAQAHAADGHFQRPLAGLVERAQAAQYARRDVGVVEPAVLLDRTRRFHAGAHLLRGHSVILAPQLLVRHRRYFDVQVDAVEQRAAHLAQVALDDGAGAAALSGGVGKKSAPSADFCSAVRPPFDSLSRRSDTEQISWGKLNRLLCTIAGSTLRTLDG